MSRTELLLIVIIVMIGLLIGLVPFFYFQWRQQLRRHWILESEEIRYLWERSGFRPFGPAYGTPLFDLLEEAQRRHNVELSWAARAMITIPILEQLEDERRVNWAEVDSSINKIVETMREESPESDRSRRGQRNAVGVIKAFFKQFCSIPPFCSPTEETRRRG